MGAGKYLSVLAGIITLISTFILSWVAVDDGGTIYYAYGIGIIKNIVNMFTNADALGVTLGVPSFAIYIIAGSLIWFLSAGFTQLAGVKSRLSAIIGSIMPLLIGGIILFFSFSAIPTEWVVNIVGDSVPLIDGIIPFNFAIAGRPESIGTYLLLLGGIIGLISGFMSREKY